MTDSFSGQRAAPSLDSGVAVDDLANGVEWVIRPYREGDIPAIVTLVNAIDAAYRLEDAISEDDLRRALTAPRSDPLRQVVVVDGPRVDGVPAGGLLGFGRIDFEDDEAASERIWHFRASPHPNVEGRRVEQAIARRLLEIIHEYERDPKMKPLKKVTVKRYMREEFTPGRELARQMGMREVRQYWSMSRSLHEPIDEPQPVDGVLIRPYKRPEDNATSCTAYNDSFFDHWDHHDIPQEDWDHWISSPNKKPELSWLAESEDEPDMVAGFCIVEVFDAQNKRYNRLEGWIDVLGTTREWRRKGLGRALLLHGLHSLREAGLDTAMIGVDSENLTGAHRLYESVGFRIRYREVQYECDLEEVTM